MFSKKAKSNLPYIHVYNFYIEAHKKIKNNYL